MGTRAFVLKTAFLSKNTASAQLWSLTHDRIEHKTF